MDEYLATIKAFAFNFPPQGWALCNGALLSISQYTAVFSLVGTTYGGNGQTTFGLPDLRGRVAVGMGQGPGLQNYPIGQVAGIENVTLITSQMPAHNHTVTAFSDPGDTSDPNGALWANTGGLDPEYRKSAGAGGTTTMGLQAINTTGSNQPHPNLQPFLVINYSICLIGIYPSRN